MSALRDHLSDITSDYVLFTTKDRYAVTCKACGGNGTNNRPVTTRDLALALMAMAGARVHTYAPGDPCCDCGGTGKDAKATREAALDILARDYAFMEHHAP